MKEKIATFYFIKLLLIVRRSKEKKKGKASHTLPGDIYNAHNQYRINIKVI